MNHAEKSSNGVGIWSPRRQGHILGACKLLLLGALLVLSETCSTSPVESLMKHDIAKGVNLTDFRICQDYGCHRRVHVRLSNAEWGEIKALFEPPAEAAAEERIRIARAIALLEQQVGRKTETSDDLPKSPVLLSGRRGQMDCVDEAYNTTLCLTLLKREGLIRWHGVGRPVRRGNIIDCYTHNTAIIIELASSLRFAVDSWFHANGELPEIVPIDIWLTCWKP